MLRPLYGLRHRITQKPCKNGNNKLDWLIGYLCALTSEGGSIRICNFCLPKP